MKKIIFVIFAVLTASVLFGKDLVYIPTAVSCDGIGASYSYGVQQKNSVLKLEGGINGFEVSLSHYKNANEKFNFMDRNKVVLSGQWQILPEVGFVPAVAVGVKDLGCTISRKPSFYGVATKDFADFIPGEFVDRLALTLGVSNDSLGFFGGVEGRISCFYGTFEAYREECSYSAGLSVFDDVIRIGYKRFNKNDYITANAGITF